MYRFAVYFYQIRWFDITAFASKAPKVQEVVVITASGPPPFVWKYYKLYIQQISQRYRLCSGREGPECETMYRLAVYFYQIRWFDITAFASKAPKVQEVVVITASAPPPLHSFANIINYIYSKFHNDLACIRAVVDQNAKKCTDFAVYFYQIRWFDITAFASKAPKVREVVEITASGPPPFVCKYYKLYIQQIS